MKKKLWLYLLILCFTLTFLGCAASSVAEVNGEKISVEDFQSYWQNLQGIYDANGTDLSEDMRETVVNQMVYDLLLAQTAKDLNCVSSDEEIQTYYEEQMASIYGSYDAAVEALKTYQVDEDFFHDQYESQLTEEKITDVLAKDTDVSVSKEEAQEIFDADPDSYNIREISHILIKPHTADGKTAQTDEDGNTSYTEEEWATAKKRAQEIIAQLDDNGDFATLAYKYSDDDSTSATGGKITETLSSDSDSADEAVVKAAFQLKEVGAYTEEPVKTEDGYEIILCDRVLSPDDDLDAVINYIIQRQTASNRKELLASYMEKQEEAATIEYHYDAAK